MRLEPTRPDTPRILHVTESMGGGTAGAIVEFVRSTPQYEHHLLFRRRHGSELAIAYDTLFAGWHEAPPGPVRLGRALREVLPRVAPGIVHLHSTWAGLVGRTVVPAALRSARGPAIVYTPHCFGFERTDVPHAVRRLAQAAERAVAAGTDLAVCVSPREASLAASLGMPSVLVPNTTRARVERLAAVRGRRSIVTVGRVGPQKGIDFLLRVKALLPPDCRWTWIGGGEARGEAALRAAGVVVTGWLPAAAVQARLASADVYVHTAAWESCPLSLIEAAAAGLPLVARSIPALDSLGLDPALATPEAVAAELATVLATGRPSRPRLQESFMARHTPQAQVAALSAAYARALSCVEPAPRALSRV